MEIPLYQLDAFAERLFTGNPAAVCPLPHWLEDETLRRIAAENNLSETAFLVEAGDGWELRWFTPAIEVDLCGHATLAAGAVVLRRLRPGSREVRFQTRHAGTVSVRLLGERLELDFPTRPPEPCEAPTGLLQALGGKPHAALRSVRDFLVLYASEQEVAALRPNMAALAKLGAVGVIASAPGEHVDFVSRFFAPGVGVDEDPVTGSAHCVLTPYWAQELGKETLEARQISARGGTLHCSLRGERVGIAGRVTPYLEGKITLPDGAGSRV